MIKNLLTIGLSLSTALVFGQFVADSSNLPAPGFTQFVAIDTVPNAGVSAGQAGTGQQYDVSDIDFDIEQISDIILPQNAFAGNKFPQASMAIGGDQATGEPSVFFTKSASKFELIGLALPDFFGGDDTIIIRYSNPQSQFETPAAYNDGFLDDHFARGTFYFGQEFNGLQIDSVRITTEGSTDAIIDGSGTLTTIAGVFSDVLRQRAEITETETTEGCIVVIQGFPCQWQEFASETTVSVEYSFIGAQSRFPLASVSYDENETTVTGVTNNSDPTLTSIAEYAPKTVEGGIFPNPATTEFQFKEEVKSAFALNAEGKEIQLDVINNRVNISHLAKGIYTVVATNRAGFPEHHPLIVQ
ncbi:MAG: hypothetical protein ACPF8V_03230 [Luteibaculum sp.]